MSKMVNMSWVVNSDLVEHLVYIFEGKIERKTLCDMTIDKQSVFHSAKSRCLICLNKLKEIENNPVRRVGE